MITHQLAIPASAAESGGADCCSGGNMESVDRRLEQLEKDTGQIKSDLAVLTARAENFATKDALNELAASTKMGFAALAADNKVDLAGMESSTTREFSAVRGEISAVRVEMHQGFAEIRGEMHQGFSEFHKAMSSQTKWLVGVMIGLATVSLTAAKLLF